MSRLHDARKKAEEEKKAMLGGNGEAPYAHVLIPVADEEPGADLGTHS